MVTYAKAHAGAVASQMVRAERAQRQGKAKQARVALNVALRADADWDRIWRRAARLQMALGDSNGARQALAAFAYLTRRGRNWNGKTRYIPLCHRMRRRNARPPVSNRLRRAWRSDRAVRQRRRSACCDQGTGPPLHGRILAWAPSGAVAQGLIERLRHACCIHSELAATTPASVRAGADTAAVASFLFRDHPSQ